MLLNMFNFEGMEGDGNEDEIAIMIWLALCWGGCKSEPSAQAKPLSNIEGVQVALYTPYRTLTSPRRYPHI